jgi:hypothetical protein
MIPEIGIHPGVLFSVYQSWEAVNASFLTTLSHRTPYHANHDRLHPKAGTDALRVGRALHSLILEPATFDAEWAVCPACDKRTKEGKALYAAFVEAKGLRCEITEKEFSEIQEMATAVRKQQCISLVCGGRAEVSIVWRDTMDFGPGYPKPTGILCKRRLDYERSLGFNHCIVDVKSTLDAGPWAFANSIAGYGYALAAAFSIDGWMELTGESSLYTLLAIEKGYHIAKPWEPGEETIASGRQEYRKALELTAECMKRDEWPAYGTEVGLIDAPRWYLEKWGVGPDLIRPEPSAPRGGVPEGQEESEFDVFLKGESL